MPGGHVGGGSLTSTEYRAHPWAAALAGDQPGLTWDAGHHPTVFLSGTLGFDPRTHNDQVRIGPGGASSEYGTGPRSVNDALGVVFTACRVHTGMTRAATVEAANRADSDRTNGTTRFEPDQPIVHDYHDGTSLVIAIELERRALVSQRQARDLAVRADVSPRLDDQSTWIVVR